MILLVGCQCEEISRVKASLEKKGISTYWLNPDDQIELRIFGGQVVWSLPRFGEIAVSNDEIDWPFAAGFLKNYGPSLTYPEESDHWTPKTVRESIFYDAEMKDLLKGFLYHLQETGIPIYNGVTRYGDQKPLHLVKMALNGIACPDTLFTRSLDSINSMFQHFDGEVIYKAVGSGSQANRLEKIDLEQRANLLFRAPVAFQELARGKDVRIYVCDGDLLAAIEVDTNREVDFRGFETDFRYIELSENLRDAALRTAELKCQRYSGIDARVLPDGSFKILEANSSPVFTYLDPENRIADGLAQKLSAHL
jgi:glutathione synthase/RimK-type ligase-like ATP-grasp enzyme